MTKDDQKPAKRHPRVLGEPHHHEVPPHGLRTYVFRHLVIPTAFITAIGLAGDFMDRRKREQELLDALNQIKTQSSEQARLGDMIPAPPTEAYQVASNQRDRIIELLIRNKSLDDFAPWEIEALRLDYYSYPQHIANRGLIFDESICAENMRGGLFILHAPYQITIARIPAQPGPLEKVETRVLSGRALMDNVQEIAIMPKEEALRRMNESFQDRGAPARCAPQQPLTPKVTWRHRAEKDGKAQGRS